MAMQCRASGNSMNAVKASVQSVFYRVFTALPSNGTEMGTEVGSYEGGVDIASRLGRQ